eukprot:944196-Ditylum_brightwellii.AAC.1
MVPKQSIAKLVSLDLPTEEHKEDEYAIAQEDESSRTGNNDDAIEEKVNYNGHKETNNEYDTELNFLPIPLFSSMDVSYTAAQTYEDFINYKAGFT